MTDKSILDRLDSWAQVVGPANNIYADAAAHIRALMAEAERARAQALQPRKFSGWVWKMKFRTWAHKA